MRLSVTCVIFALAAADAALANPLFPAGSENKAIGMESALASRRGSAVLYNPANLSLTPTPKPYVEVGFVNVHYSYEHPDYDPVSLSVNSPVVTLGYSGRLAPRWAIGGVFFPTKNGATDVPGLPRNIGGETYSVAVKNEELAFSTGVGVAFLAQKNLSLGLSLLHTYESQKLSANLVGSEASLMKSEAKGNFFRPRLGGYYRFGNLRTALSYAPRQKKTYQGSYESSAAPGESAPQQKGFEPDVVDLGLGLRWHELAVQGDLTYRGWRAGRDVIKAGTGADGQHADLVNTLDKGLSATYFLRPRTRLELGYSLKPSPWGDGRSGNVADQVDGVDFGYLNGLDLKTLSFGGAATLWGSTELSLSLLRSTGEREVGENKENRGFYELSMTAVSMTMSRSF